MTTQMVDFLPLDVEIGDRVQIVYNTDWTKDDLSTDGRFIGSVGVVKEAGSECLLVEVDGDERWLFPYKLAQVDDLQDFGCNIPR